MNNWSTIYNILDEIEKNVARENDSENWEEYCENKMNVELPYYIKNIEGLSDAYNELKQKYDNYIVSRSQSDLNEFLSSINEFRNACKEKETEKSEYDQKINELNTMLKDLDDICERATKNSLYSKWHIDMLDEAKSLLEQINKIAEKEGRPTVSVDFSKYAFNPSELKIDGLDKSYAEYEDLKSIYDGEILPKYYDAYEKYFKGEISLEEYNKYVDETSRYNIALKSERIQLMENIRTAVTDDYIKRPQHEVQKYLDELHEYNEKLKEYNKLYKELSNLRANNGDKGQIDTVYQTLTLLSTQLQEKRPGLVKERGLIYNPKTLKDLASQKAMIEEILKDTAKSNDKGFETVKAQYENKLQEIDELIENIIKFRNSLTVGKIKPLEPIKEPKSKEARRGRFVLPIYSEGESYNLDDEIKKLFGPDAKVDDFDITEISRDNMYVEYEAVEKRKKRSQGNRSQEKAEDKDYDFDKLEDPGFIIPDDKIIVPPVPVPPVPTPPVPEPRHQKETKYFNLEELLKRITDGAEPEESIKYTKFDDFVYRNKDIKIWNVPKSFGVTVLDKPFKYAFKAPISAAVNGISKLIAKFGYNNEKVRKNIDGILERINQLTDEEIEFLLQNLTANKMTELSGMIPEVAMSALNDRLINHYINKVNAINKEIETYYYELITNYYLYETLTDEKEKAALDSKLCQTIINIQMKQQYSNDLNKGGSLSFMESWNAKHNGSAGGRNIGRLYNENAGKTYSFTHIQDYVNSGRGYLAARDFLYGEKVKINGTKMEHKAKNWFHQTRTGAFEFKPFVEVVDYSKDTYLQDVFATLTIAANITNMLYIKNLQSQLADAERQIQSANQQIASFNQQKQLIQAQLNNINQQITANNQAIIELKKIAALYNTDPQQFIEKLAEFAQMENANTHGFTEYTLQMAQAGKNNTLMLSSSGQIYNQFDAPAHIFSKDIRDSILRIKNDVNLTASQKAHQMSDVLKGINQNLAQSLPQFKQYALDYLLLPGSNQWSLEAFVDGVNLVSSYDSSFVPTLFSSFVDAAIKINDLNVINTVTGLNIPNIQALSTIALNIPQASLIPAIVSLSTLIGKEATQSVIDEYKKNPKKFQENLWKDKTEELAKKISDIPMDLEKEAQRIYEEKKQEFNSKSPWYRLTHRKEQKELEELAYAEARKNAGYEDLGRNK